MKYWRSKGKYQTELEQLQKSIVPDWGKADNDTAEIIRCVININHDIGNNGFGNADVRMDEVEFIHDYLDSPESEKLLDIARRVGYERMYEEEEMFDLIDDVIDQAVERVLSDEGRDDLIQRKFTRYNNGLETIGFRDLSDADEVKAALVERLGDERLTINPLELGVTYPQQDDELVHDFYQVETDLYKPFILEVTDAEYQTSDVDAIIKTCVMQVDKARTNGMTPTEIIIDYYERGEYEKMVDAYKGCTKENKMVVLQKLEVRGINSVAYTLLEYLTIK